MNKKQLSFGLVGLLVFSWVVLRDVKGNKSWHDFFVAPSPKEGKLLEKAPPLSITKETNQRMKGGGQGKSEKIRFALFEDMCKNIKQEEQEEGAKVKPEPIIPEAVKVTKKITVKSKKVIQKVKKSVSPLPEKDYFPVSFERKGRKNSMQVHNSFISGYICGTQELKHGRSIKISVKEAFSYKGKAIPKGAILYGVVAFGKERILSKLETAAFGKNSIPVSIGLYDTDYTIGLLVEDVLPFMDHAQDKLLSRAAGSSSNSWIREISTTAVDAIKSMKKEPKVTIENRRKVLLKPIEK